MMKVYSTQISMRLTIGIEQSIAEACNIVQSDVCFPLVFYQPINLSAAHTIHSFYKHENIEPDIWRMALRQGKNPSLNSNCRVGQNFRFGAFHIFPIFLLIFCIERFHSINRLSIRFIVIHVSRYFKRNIRAIVVHKRTPLYNRIIFNRLISRMQIFVHVIRRCNFNASKKLTD